MLENPTKSGMIQGLIRLHCHHSDDTNQEIVEVLRVLGLTLSK